MEWFWEVLGIEATTNVADIKRAYVTEMRRLKTLETKEEVSQEAYAKLAEAETAAISFIEELKRSGGSLSVQSSERTSYLEDREQPKKEVEGLQEVVESVELPEIKEDIMMPISEELIVKSADRVEDKVTEKVSLSTEKSEPIKRNSELKARLEDAKKAKQEVETAISAEIKISESASESEGSLEKQAVASQDFTEKVSNIADRISQISHNAAVPSRFINDCRELLADWSRKFLLKEWEGCFRYRRQWSNEEFTDIREKFLPLLKLQLSYLPKEVLWYLYDELDLATYELNTSFNWFMAIDDLPDFEFEVAVYLPEEEVADYFDRRLHLYHVIVADDWHSRSFEIDEGFAYFYEEEWLADYQIVDQDVENLAAIYETKKGLEKLVHNNEPNREIAKHLLAPESELDRETNQTAKFLRIIFTSLKTKTISLEHGLFIENPQTNYVEDNLREVLVGLVFYRSKDQVKATKHFNNLTNDYQGLVKGLQNSVGFKGLAARPSRVDRVEKSKKTIDFKLILRVIVIGAIGLSFLSNAFSNDDEAYYDDDTDYVDSDYVDSDYDDDWLNPEDPGYDFLTYFIEKSDDRAEIESLREDYIEKWVSPDLSELFEGHITDERIDGSRVYDVIYKEIDDQTAYYLITQDDAPYLIIEVSDWEWVTAVIGDGWQEVEPKAFDELVAKAKTPVSEIVDQVIVGYFLLPSDEREEAYDTISELVDSEVSDRLAWDLSIVEDRYFETGSYQISQTTKGQQALLVNDDEGELSLILLLDDYGRVSEIVETAYDKYSENELTYLTEHAEKKQPLPTGDMVDL